MLPMTPHPWSSTQEVKHHEIQTPQEPLRLGRSRQAPLQAKDN